MSLFSDVVKCTKDSETVKQKCPIASSPNIQRALPLSASYWQSKRLYLPHSSSGTSE